MPARFQGGSGTPVEPFYAILRKGSFGLIVSVVAGVFVLQARFSLRHGGF